MKSLRTFMKLPEMLQMNLINLKSEEDTMVFQFTLKDLKNYRAGGYKAGIFGKSCAMKNYQPDAELLSITEYERLLVFIEYLESREGKDLAKLIDSLPKEGKKKQITIDHLISDRI